MDLHTNGFRQFAIAIALTIFACSPVLAQPDSGNQEHRSDASESQWDPIDAEKRAEAIRKRIDVIREIFAKKKAEAEERENALATSNVTPPEAHADSLSFPASPPAIDLVPPGVTDSNDLPQEFSNPQEATGSVVESPREKPAVPSGKPEIHSQPVNSYDLANSLFATGSYAQALKSYEMLMQADGHQNEQAWIKCLAANCWRIQGDTANAEKLYRETAAQRDHPYPSDHAKWYLDHLTRRKQIEAALSNINVDLQAYEQGSSQKGK